MGWIFQNPTDDLQGSRSGLHIEWRFRMPEVKILDHNGQRVLLIDLSNAYQGKGVAETAEEAIRIVISTNQKKSIRGMIDLSGTPLTTNVRNAMKRMSQNNGPYMKSVAFVGLGNILSILIKGFLVVSGRSNHRVFSTRREALDWLAKS